MLAQLQYHTNVPLGVCDRDTENVSSSTKNRGMAESETLNIPYSPCFPYVRTYMLTHVCVLVALIDACLRNATVNSCVHLVICLVCA